MLLFTVANPGDKPIQLTSIRLPLEDGANMVFPYMEGERRLLCFVAPFTSLKFWVKLSDVEESIRGRGNYTGSTKIHAVATDALDNEYISNSVDIGAWTAAGTACAALRYETKSPRPAPGALLIRQDPAYRLTWRLAPPLGPLSGPLPRTSPLETSLTQSEPSPL
jgi:hypothetical protein